MQADLTISTAPSCTWRAEQCTKYNSSVQAAFCGVGSHYILTGPDALDIVYNFLLSRVQLYLTGSSVIFSCPLSTTFHKQFPGWRFWSILTIPLLPSLQQRNSPLWWIEDPGIRQPASWTYPPQAALCGVGSLYLLTGLAALDCSSLWHFIWTLIQRLIFGVGSLIFCTGPSDFNIHLLQQTIYTRSDFITEQQYSQAAHCGVGSHCTLTGLAAWDTTRRIQQGVGSPSNFYFTGRSCNHWITPGISGLDIPADCSNKDLTLLDPEDSLFLWQTQDTTFTGWGGLPLLDFFWPNISVISLLLTLFYSAGTLALIAIGWTCLRCISFFWHLDYAFNSTIAFDKPAHCCRGP